MRTPDFGVPPRCSEKFSEDVSLEIFRRMCMVRHFEAGLIEAVKARYVTGPVYLSTGQEAISAALSLALDGFQVLAQHRCHGIYLCAGGSPERLRDELLGLPTGTSGGRAGSNCVQCHEEGISMYGHHGLIGENVPLGVGVALGSGRPVLCLFGDGAAEEDYVFASMGFAATHRLPVIFVCEDNNFSILTPVAVRRSWSVTGVAGALGMETLELSDDPWAILERAGRMKQAMPGFLNISTCRANWHVGIGEDGPPEWDRFALVRDELKRLGLKSKAERIENEIEGRMRALWDEKPLLKLLRK